MKERKLPNLRTMVFLQAFTALLMPVYFIVIWTAGLKHFKYVLWMMVLVLIGSVFQSWLVRQVKAQTDERALQTLRTAESSCFHSAESLVVTTVVMLCANRNENVFPWIMERLEILLTAALFLIYLERAILFAYWDRKGLPPC